jgi:hypothetical protein
MRLSSWAALRSDSEHLLQLELFLRPLETRGATHTTYKKRGKGKKHILIGPKVWERH